MPLYTYRCKNCGVQFDQRQHFDDAPLEKCPECGKKALRKVYLPVGILFKGPGFYATDHRSASGANGSYSKKEESASESSDSGETTEKPAKQKSSESKPSSED